MSKLTALQQAMRIVEKHAYNLFNVYNADSREFLDEMAKCLELEREQMIDAYSNGWHDGQDVILQQCKHIDKGGGDAGQKHYNYTYKGGEQ